MTKRKIIKIDEEKCNGCGLCMPNCPEGALRVIDGKARLISDLFCDGLGACIGHCPEGAIAIEEREAERYNEKRVMANIAKQGANVIKAHLEHLKNHNQPVLLRDAVDYLKENGIDVPLMENTHVHAGSGCPGAKIIDFKKRGSEKEKINFNAESELSHWPIQLMLVPPFAPYLKDADLLIAADCVPFAYPAFHQDLLKEKVLLVGCPKFDNLALYKEKIGRILEINEIKSITYVHMEVPCCFGLTNIIEQAISESGKKVPYKEAVIGIKGDRLK